MPDQPQATQIAPDALERWQTLASAGPLRLALTRDELDDLLLGLRSLAISQSQIINALSAHTQQDMNGCVEAMVTANQLCASAFERLTRLITAIMRSATPAETGGG